MVGANCSLPFALLWLTTAVRAAAPVFETDVGPVLLKACVECHSGAEPQGGLDLTTRDGLLRGGESGPAWTREAGADSLIAQRIRAGAMPPEMPLSDADQAVLLQWFAAGAGWTGGPLDLFRVTTPQRAGYDWWSLQPLQRQPPPVVVGDWCRTPVDRFVAARLATAELEPSPPASRRELIRRLTFDLLGLPPTSEQIAAFEIDDSPDAYEQLVDGLLASPNYGIRWGRHWLDLARFGESQGFERDKLRENAWPYRDWVINALNADLPYDAFARLQLAGDVLPSEDGLGVIATGFLVAGPWDEVGQNQQSAAMKLVVRQDELEDYVSLVGQTFLGLTVHCARCHDHKFDPIRQSEYYQLAAALDGVRHGSRDVLSTSDAARRDELAMQLQACERQVERLRKLARERSGAAAPEKSATATTNPTPELSETDLLALLTESDRTAWQQYADHRDQLRKQLNTVAPVSMYLVTPKPPRESRVLLRGNPNSPGEVVTPAGLAAIAGPAADWGLPSDVSDELRRQRLADWITAPDNPLFSRVIVNRVWQHHFGVGLVTTTSDFGFSGGVPSHPELLDWLASEFQRGGYSLKSLHRLLVTSAVYRQSSRSQSNATAIDADNQLLWRMSPRRLEAETLRDATLATAGELNDELGGPGYRDFDTFVRNSQFYNITDPVGPEFQRRTIYRTNIRSGRSPLLDVFDCPDPSTKTPERAVTVTPLQALSLLNNSFVLRMSERFATRVTAAAGESPEAQARHALRSAFGRPASETEVAAGADFISSAGLAEYCRVLFNASEFLYVD